MIPPARPDRSRPEPASPDPQRSRSAEAGFSLPLVLVASLMVLLGGLMLVNRSSDGVISAAFQRDSTDARDAAETGLTRILGELNRVQNRGLLAKSGSTADGDNFLWSSADASASRNLCHAAPPDLASIANLGYSTDGTTAPIYLNADGAVVSTAADASKAYRILWVKRQPLDDNDGKPILRIFQPEGRGTVQLAVEGMALRNGEVISSARLETDLQLVPKCCGVPFGGQHGNVNYAISASTGSSVCFPSGWGIVAGAAQNNTGSMTINGVTTIKTDTGDVVNPIYCIADSAEQCPFNPTSTSYVRQTVPAVLGMPPSNPVSPAPPVGAIQGDTPTSPFLSCADAADTLKDCKGDIQLNTGVAASELPSFCGAIDGASGEPGELHCNLSTLNYSSFNLNIDTSGRKLRLYFPNAGQVVQTSGNKTLQHFPAANGNSTDLSLFGCAGCGSQDVTLRGTTAGLDLFAWFPNGTVTISGSSGYSGVLWANRVTSNGGVTWVVPGSGVAGALELAGFGLEGDLNPPTFDWVARSTRRFRWFGP